LHYELVPFELAVSTFCGPVVVLPDAEIERLRGCDAILLGP